MILWVIALCSCKEKSRKTPNVSCSTKCLSHLIAKGTLDERVMEALEKKDCGQSALVDAVKARIGGVWDGCGKTV